MGGGGHVRTRDIELVVEKHSMLSLHCNSSLNVFVVHVYPTVAAIWATRKWVHMKWAAITRWNAINFPGKPVSQFLSVQMYQWYPKLLSCRIKLMNHPIQAFIFPQISDKSCTRGLAPLSLVLSEKETFRIMYHPRFGLHCLFCSLGYSSSCRSSQTHEKYDKAIIPGEHH